LFEVKPGCTAPLCGQVADLLGYRSPMTETSFFWHDYETFGTNPRADRPSQFAGVRTDADLNEIAPPLVRYCQPAPDFLPDPQACLLTGITPQICIERGIAENRFAADIEHELALPGTVGVGYNSIRFDDEVSRHLFWRNLIDPYAREWQNGCGRWDLLDALRCAHALRPQGIHWPKREDGFTAFKLEALTAANSLPHDSAHDALSDVRATIALARLLRQAQPRLWDFCLGLRKKDAVWHEIGVGLSKPFLHISGMFPAERGHIAVVWPLAAHPTNRNELIVWDLSRDPAELEGLSATDIRSRMFVRSDDLPEGQTRLPIKTLHINRSPIVIGKLQTLSAPRAADWGIDTALALRHAQAAAVIAPQLASLWSEVFERPKSDDAVAVDVDEDLYGGLLSRDDRRALDRLRGLTPEALANSRAGFDDQRLSELVFRYRARNFPASLTEAETQRWQTHCADRLHRGAGGARSLANYLEQIDALAETTTSDSAQEILGALVDYGEAIAPENG
jgi:exodeoxyribonuclease-1